MTIMARKPQLAKEDQPEATPISAVTVWSLPLPTLLNRTGVGLEEVPYENLPGALRSHFCGLLVQDANGAPVIVVPAGQDDREREQRVRKLIWRHLTGTTTQDNGRHAIAARVARTAAAQIVAHPERPTVTVTTPHGDIFTTPERDWCAGHSRPEWPEDIAHASAETSARITLPSGEDGTLLSGGLLEYPYGLTDTEPVAAIALPGGDIADFDEAGLDRLAAELRAAAAWAENLRDQLAAAKASSR